MEVIVFFQQFMAPFLIKQPPLVPFLPQLVLPHVLSSQLSASRQCCVHTQAVRVGKCLEHSLTLTQPTVTESRDVTVGDLQLTRSDHWGPRDKSHCNNFWVTRSHQVLKSRSIRWASFHTAVYSEITVRCGWRAGCVSEKTNREQAPWPATVHVCRD